jgi:hypothetical protein
MSRPMEGYTRGATQGMEDIKEERLVGKIILKG